MTQRIDIIAPAKVPPLAVSIENAARLLSISSRTLGKYVRDGSIPSVIVGGRRLLRMSTLDSWLAARESAGGQP